MSYNFLEKEKELFLTTYKRLPVQISHGEGVHLIDKNGRKYLDFFSGLAVNALGQAHPGIIEAVCKQITRFSHLSNIFVTDVQIKFTQLLLKHSGMSKAFLCNSGTEAVEAAIKIIRKYKGPDKKILALTNSFHGRTYGAVSLTHKAKYKEGFEPLLQNIDHVTFNDVQNLKEKIDINTAGIFIELIQGEGGINILSDEFVQELLELKKKYNFLICADEIQSGIGRTGKPFAYNHYNFVPDLITLAKAIGGGLPLGAVLTSKALDNIFDSGKHGTTFGGNSVCCAAGLVVLQEVLEKGLMENVKINGEYFFNELKNLQELFPEIIKDVRGKGFMIGIELTFDCTNFVRKLLERNVLINCTNFNVLRILPPLIAQKEDIDFFLYNFHEMLKQADNKNDN